jgi:hypothetical protein
MENLKNSINKIYNQYTKDIQKIVQKIHENPELSEEETLACKTK